MKFGRVPVASAVGSILAHKLVDDEGRKILSKGTPLTPEHVALLQRCGFST
ncbi:MAG: hypothetical protein U0703_13155 [Anaerolineae bacterium]